MSKKYKSLEKEDDVAMKTDVDGKVGKSEFAAFDDISIGGGTQKEIKNALSSVITALKGLKTIVPLMVCL